MLETLFVLHIKGLILVFSIPIISLLAARDRHCVAGAQGYARAGELRAPVGRRQPVADL